MVNIDNNAQPVAEKVYDQPTVGLIVPPPEIRSIVEKTAQFVARNGENFEHKIRQNEAQNPKFNFLKDEDPYHGYYRHKVSHNWLQTLKVSNISILSNDFKLPY